MNKKIIIGSRGSNLSLAYANKVKSLILNKRPNLSIEIVKIKTTGDIFKEKKISELGGKNYFCKEIEEQLINNQIDIAVHAFKDLDSFGNKNLTIGAFMKRNDNRDALVLRDKHEKASDTKTKIIGTNSRRRSLQLKLIDENTQIKEIRGNIDTRIKKLSEKNYDGIILAMAGLKTLKLDQNVTKIFNTDQMISCAGQGVIVAQCKIKDKKIISILNQIDHSETRKCAEAEKILLQTIGGDCHTAIGVFAQKIDKKFEIIAQLFSDDGKENFSVKKKCDESELKNVAIIAGRELLKVAGSKYKKKK